MLRHQLIIVNSKFCGQHKALYSFSSCFPVLEQSSLVTALICKLWGHTKFLIKKLGSFSDFLSLNSKWELVTMTLIIILWSYFGHYRKKAQKMPNLTFMSHIKLDRIMLFSVPIESRFLQCTRNPDVNYEI